MNNYAIDTAARFGDIPFVDFTKDLVKGVFDSLVEAHLLQMEEYTDFVNSLTQDLSVYINNTADGVDFDQISDFILNFELPQIDGTVLTTILAQLEAPDDPETNPMDPSDPDADPNKWWGGLINALAPAVTGLVDKIGDPSEALDNQALAAFNNAVLDGADTAANTITYQDIYGAVAALITSNKYSILQTMAKQGAMRLVVTEGEIETKITFSTWNSNTRGTESSAQRRVIDKAKEKDVRGGGIIGIFRSKRKRKYTNRTVTVNTAKSYQRDSSGTSVNIFGRVLIRFKTDYAPLNG